MKLRLAVVFVASLAIASLAHAACLTCIGDGATNDGTCQPSSNGRCSYTCCLSDQGSGCDVRERTFGCSDELVMPAAYFATPLPFQMQGSALRLRLGKGKPLPRQCAASVLLKKS
jgi:hypothetical protein